MKIAFFSVFPLEYGGGLEKYYIQTASYLADNFNEIENVSIINLNDKFYFKLCKFISLSRFYKLKPTYRENEKIIKSKISKKVQWFKIDHKELASELNRYNVIYTKNEILELFLLNNISVNRNIKIIAGVHTAPKYLITRSLVSKLHNFLYDSLFYKWLAKKVNIFHVINSYDERLLKARFADKKIINIYNPFYFGSFISNAKKYKFNFNWNKSKFNILWTGRITEQKGVNDLINIINYINNIPKYKNKIVWNITGDGEEKQKIIDTQHKWDNINYFGYVNTEYMPNIYEENDLFISTSKWEVFPYNILEAQAIGVPVISYDIPGPQDIVLNHKTGLLVNSLDEFIKAIIEYSEGRYNLENISEYTNSKFNADKIYINLFNMLNSAK